MDALFEVINIKYKAYRVFYFCLILPIALFEHLGTVYTKMICLRAI